MFIRNCMTNVESLVTIQENEKVGNALKLFKENGLKSAPVVDKEGKYVGILSKEGLFEVLESGKTTSLHELKEQSIIDAIDRIKPLQLDNRFEQTFPIIVRYPFVPITDENNHFFGIIKRQEITNALESSFGVGVPGVRLLIGTAEMEGRLEKILEIVHQLQIDVITAVAFDAGERFNRRILLKVKHSEQASELIHRLEKHGFSILTIHED